MILVGTGPAVDAKRRLLERAGALVVDEAADAQVAVVVEDDAAVARLKARGVLVNAVDRPALCDFTLPSIVDRAPLLVAVGTGGASAGLAKAVRMRIEAMLPADLGELANALYAARPDLRAIAPDPLQRRQLLDQAMTEGGPLDPLRSGWNVADWLQSEDGALSGDTVVIQLRSADPDDLTLREARWLAQAERVFHVEHAPIAVLARARADAERHVLPLPADPGAGLTVVLQ